MIICPIQCGKGLKIDYLNRSVVFFGSRRELAVHTIGGVDWDVSIFLSIRNSINVTQ